MSKQFSANFAFNVVGALMPMIVSLATVPFYLHELGTARYGVVAISWTLLGYFGFLNFGLSRATTNALGRLAHAPAAERAPVLMTALYLNVIFGCVGGLCIYVAGHLFFLDTRYLPGELIAEVRAVFLWLVPMLPLGMIEGVGIGSLESRDRFFISNLLSSIGMIAGQVVPLLCVWHFGASLTVVIPAIVVVRMVVVVTIMLVALYLERPLDLTAFDLQWARKLLGYGAWVSVSSLISPILETFDQILIGRMLGPSAIAHYTVPMNLSIRAQVVASALARTVFPSMSRQDAPEGQRLTTDAVVWLVYVFGAICGPAIIVLDPVLQVWVGSEFAQNSRLVGQILLFGAWANGVAFLPFTMLLAQGKPKVPARVHAMEVVPFVIALWLLISHLGLPGAAIAWTGRVSVDCILLLWLSGCLARGLKRSLPGVALMVTCLVLSQFTGLGWASSLAMGIAAGIAFLGVGLLVEPTLRSTFKTALELLAHVRRKALAH